MTALETKCAPPGNQITWLKRHGITEMSDLIPYVENEMPRIVALAQLAIDQRTYVEAVWISNFVRSRQPWSDRVCSAINRYGGRAVNRGDRLGLVWHDAAMLRVARILIALVCETLRWRLTRRDRRVIAAGDLSERQVAALRTAKAPDLYADLDRELEDNTP